MASHRLKLLAISDTHLGEETSLLSFPRGIQHVWTTLADDPEFWKPVFPDFVPNFEGGVKVEVEELVLVGDIPDRTLSSTSQISAHTHAFAMMLGSALDIEKAVYVPGNHDHTLWTSLAEANRSSGDGSSGITDPGGELLVEGGVCSDEAAVEILSILFGYPIGWAWWTIDKQREFDFAIANPVYAKAINSKTYAFAHGTHFRRELVSEWQKGFLKAFDVFQLDRLLELELKKSGDLDQVESMEELERMATPFVDSLWPSSKNNPTSRSDELWYLLTLLREGSGQGRETPPASTIFSRRTALPEDVEGRINLLTDGGEPTDGSLRRFREHFLPCLIPHLEYQDGILQNDLTFVYGDTHRGGWGTLAPSEAWGRPIDVYNCGAWVVDGPDHHPACHLFAVDEDGKEHLLDLSFGDVKVGDDTLLGLAAKDAEHRLKVVNRGVRAFGATLQLMESSYGTGFRFLNNLF